MSDPSSGPEQVPDTAIVDPEPEPEQGGAPRTDAESAPALQERDAGGEDLLT